MDDYACVVCEIVKCGDGVALLAVIEVNTRAVRASPSGRVFHYVLRLGFNASNEFVCGKALRHVPVCCAYDVASDDVFKNSPAKVYYEVSRMLPCLPGRLYSNGSLSYLASHITLMEVLRICHHTHYLRRVYARQDLKDLKFCDHAVL